MHHRHLAVVIGIDGHHAGEHAVLGGGKHCVLAAHRMAGDADFTGVNPLCPHQPIGDDAGVAGQFYIASEKRIPTPHGHDKPPRSECAGVAFVLIVGGHPTRQEDNRGCRHRRVVRLVERDRHVFTLMSNRKPSGDDLMRARASQISCRHADGIRRQRVVGNFDYGMVATCGQQKQASGKNKAGEIS